MKGRGEEGAERLRRAARVDLAGQVRQLEEEMHLASADLRFEEAARIRDEIVELRQELQAAR